MTEKFAIYEANDAVAEVMDWLNWREGCEYKRKETLMDITTVSYYICTHPSNDVPSLCIKIICPIKNAEKENTRNTVKSIW